MSEKFGNTYRISSSRLPHRDYGSVGYYFVTICVKERLMYPFGKIENCEIVLSALGLIAFEYWKKIPQYNTNVEIDMFVVMPDHIHGLIFITDKLNSRYWQSNNFGIQGKNLGQIVRGYKSAVSSFAKRNSIAFAWQSRYYDRVVRNERELEKLRQYIFDNPMKWELNQREGMWM